MPHHADRNTLGTGPPQGDDFPFENLEIRWIGQDEIPPPGPNEDNDLRPGPAQLHSLLHKADPGGHAPDFEGSADFDTVRPRSNGGANRFDVSANEFRKGPAAPWFPGDRGPPESRVQFRSPARDQELGSERSRSPL